MEHLPESKKIEQLQLLLSESATLKNLLNLIKSITDKHNDYGSATFTQSDHFKFLTG